jgi:RecJ-like exonuclease
MKKKNGVITMDMLDSKGQIRENNKCNRCGGIFKIMNAHKCNKEK